MLSELLLDLSSAVWSLLLFTDRSTLAATLSLFNPLKRSGVTWSLIEVFNAIQVHFYRAACNAMHGIAVAILSVCLSVRLSDACIVAKLNDELWYFDTKRNSNHSSFPTPTLVGGRCPFPCQIFAESDPPPSKNANFDRCPLMTSQQ